MLLINKIPPKCTTFRCLLESGRFSIFDLYKHPSFMWRKVNPDHDAATTMFHCGYVFYLSVMQCLCQTFFWNCGRLSLVSLDLHTLSHKVLGVFSHLQTVALVEA
ncbi:hypothetical protein ATANTOWER_001797 [Ataeniobius toweri]|uniref:Uncharacterized protein n=1 Tax=Ataeniobius toweri TaxID=208326 RepID=A0ABU7B704_9TELE|nr:hypothetical protein [Ataeniobius toweri]